MLPKNITRMWAVGGMHEASTQWRQKTWYDIDTFEDSPQALREITLLWIVQDPRLRRYEEHPNIVVYFGTKNTNQPYECEHTVMGDVPLSLSTISHKSSLCTSHEVK